MLAGACRPGHAAWAHTAAPPLPLGRRPLALALICVQIALPGEIRRDELDGLLVLRELDSVERELNGRDRVFGEGGESR